MTSAAWDLRQAQQPRASPTALPESTLPMRCTQEMSLLASAKAGLSRRQDHQSKRLAKIDKRHLRLTFRQRLLCSIRQVP